MSASPEISIIVPVYNYAKYVEEAIRSILSQDYQDFELILVDDGSNDDSPSILERFKSPTVRILRQSNQGTGAARNLGIKNSRGRFFSFLDADDVWLKNKLTLQMTAFEEEPQLDLVFGHVEEFISPDLTSEQIKKVISFSPGAVPGYSSITMVVKRDSFFRVGLFGTDLEVGEYVDWYARAKDLKLKCLMLPDLVAKRRIHTANNGIQKKDKSAYLKILRASLERKKRSRFSL